MQQKAVARILGPNGFTDKDKLVTLKSLPVLLLQELHVVLLLAKIMNGNIYIIWTIVCRGETTEAKGIHNFAILPPDP